MKAEISIISVFFFFFEKKSEKKKISELIEADRELKTKNQMNEILE